MVADDSWCDEVSRQFDALSDCNYEHDGYGKYGCTDQEVAAFGKLSAEKMIATLDRMIGASTDTDGVSSRGFSHEDALARLEDECAVLKDDLASQERANDETKSRLLQELHGLQSRYEISQQELGTLKQKEEALNRIKSEKVEAVRSVHDDLLARLTSEREAKAAAEAKFAETMQELKDKAEFLSGRIKTDWQDQMALAKKLDDESASQYEEQNELFEERKKSTRQLQDIVLAFNPARAPPPAPIVALQQMLHSFGDNLHQPRLRSYLRDGWPEWQTQEDAPQSQSNHLDELRANIRREKERAMRELEAHAERHKQHTLDAFNKRRVIEDVRKKHATHEHHSNVIKKRMEEIAEGGLPSPRTVVSDSSASPRSVALNADFAKVLHTIEEYEKNKRKTEGVKSAIVDMRRKLSERRRQAEQRQINDRQQWAQLYEEVKQFQVEKQRKSSELRDQKYEKEKLVKQRIEVHEQVLNCQTLTTLQEKLDKQHEVLSQWVHKNDELDDALVARRRCCAPVRGHKYQPPAEEPVVESKPPLGKSRNAGQMPNSSAGQKPGPGGSVQQKQVQILEASPPSASGAGVGVGSVPSGMKGDTAGAKGQPPRGSSSGPGRAQMPSPAPAPRGRPEGSAGSGRQPRQEQGALAAASPPGSSPPASTVPWSAGAPSKLPAPLPAGASSAPMPIGAASASSQSAAASSASGYKPAVRPVPPIVTSSRSGSASAAGLPPPNTTMTDDV